jgi:hypothetical protein
MFTVTLWVMAVVCCQAQACQKGHEGNKLLFHLYTS